MFLGSISSPRIPKFGMSDLDEPSLGTFGPGIVPPVADLTYPSWPSGTENGWLELMVLKKMTIPD